MSIWKLPLAVHMPEVRTPTPAPLGLLGRSHRYGLTVLDAACAAAEKISIGPGCELVRRCAACACASTDSLAGAAGWRVLRRNGSTSITFCPECYRDFEPVRVAVAGRYAAACENHRAARRLVAERPRCADAHAALALAGLVLVLERREWLDCEQDGSRKAS